MFTTFVLEMPERSQHTKVRRSVARFLLVSFLLWAFSDVAQGGERVVGTVSYRILGDEGTASFSGEFPFRCDLAGVNWEIKIDYPNYSELAAFDGEQTYYLNVPGSGSDANVGQVGWVSEAKFPFDFVSIGKALWLTFAPKERVDVGQSFPSIDMQDLSNPLAFVLEVGLADYHEDSDLLKKLELRYSRDPVSTAFSNPYRGYTVATNNIVEIKGVLEKKEIAGELVTSFEILSVTNVLNRSFAKESLTKVFKVDKNRSGLFMEIRTVTREVRPHRRSIFKPKAERPLTVTDYRFRDLETAIDNITYLIPDGEWLDKENEELQRQFAAEKEVQRLAASHEKSSRGWVRGLVVFALVTFALLTLRWRRGKIGD